MLEQFCSSWCLSDSGQFDCPSIWVVWQMRCVCVFLYLCPKYTHQQFPFPCLRFFLTKNCSYIFTIVRFPIISIFVILEWCGFTEIKDEILIHNYIWQGRKRAAALLWSVFIISYLCVLNNTIQIILDENIYSLLCLNNLILNVLTNCFCWCNVFFSILS